MAKVSFEDLLNQNVGSAPQPKPVPVGTYLGKIDGLPKIRPVNRKDGTIVGIVTINIALEEAGEDVDSDELEEAGGLVRNGKARTVRSDFWQDTDSGGQGWSWQLDAFLAGFGLENMSYTAAFQELVGRDVTVSIKHRADDNGRVFVDVDRVYARD